MTEFDVEIASQQASQACRKEAEEDLEMRDIVWPLEKVSCRTLFDQCNLTDPH